MPSAFTEPIIDGTVASMPDFAKLCMRAFGPLIHMREEPLDTPYQKREPNEYYIEKIAEIEASLEREKHLTNATIIKEEKERLTEEIARYTEQLAKVKLVKERVTPLLEQVRKFKPPTVDHFKFKEYMVEQLETTLKWDGDDEHASEHLANLKDRLANIDARDIKAKRIEAFEGELVYYKEQRDKDAKWVGEANLWVEQLLDCLEPKQLPEGAK